MFSTASRPAGQSSVFGGGSTSAFGQTLASSAAQQQQPQQPALPSLAQSQAALGSSIWSPGSMTPHQKSIPEQIGVIMEKWDPGNPNCAFKYYFYNKVDPSRVPFYQPGPNENPKDWEEALQHKPGDDFIPVLAAGFAAVADRLKTQRLAIGSFNVRIHEINACLEAILSRHDLETSVRALNARRKHALLQRRSLALAAKVQVLKNRGYALSGDEDDLQKKLREVEKGVEDPALGARMEELWSRLITLRSYANSLQAELGRRGMSEDQGLGEEIEAKAKKILEDYEKQLQHLKKEVDLVKEDYEDWQKEQHKTSRAMPGR